MAEYEAGLAEFVEEKRIDDEFLAAVVSLPGWEPKYDEDGQPLPEPFDDALKMQQVGRKRVRKRLEESLTQRQPSVS